MSKLYELTSDFLQVQELIENGDYDRELLENTLECIQCSIEEKVENIVKIIKNLDGESAAYKTEIERMSENKTAIENNVKRLKEMIKQTMEVTKTDKINAGLFKVSISKNGGVAPFEITGTVPKKYMTKPEPVPDNKKIRELLETKKVDWAKLQERGTHLNIR